jgi:hypothetical protein
LALPLAITTFLGESVICSPKASAVWTEGEGAGFCSAEGEGEAEGDAAGAELAEGAGAGVGLAVAAGAGEAVGAWASALPIPSQIAVAGINATMTERGRKGRFIQISPWP